MESSEQTKNLERLQQIATELINLTYVTPNDTHTKDSPLRIAKYYNEITKFSIAKKALLEENKEMQKLNEIKQDIEVLKKLINITDFENDEIKNNSNNGLTIGPIRVYSLCAHHYAPMFGDVYIGIELREKMLGLSKYGRIAKMYAKQPIVQENYTKNLALIISTIAKAPVIVASKLRHLCMESRGIETENSVATYYHIEGYISKELKDLVLDRIL